MDTDKTQEHLRQAENVAQEIGGGIPERPLTDKELESLADATMAFAQTVTGIELHEYQEEMGWRICYSLLSEDADEITALYSRQSGKTETVAVVVCGVMVLFPILAKTLKHDDRITKFKDGVWCGIFGPGYRQAGIMWSRMKSRMYSRQAKEALLDPDIDINLSNKTENMVLPNGSFCDCGTAAPQSKIEGETYHLILLEESQDISSSMIRTAIHPMAAATAGTLVKIGTCGRNKSEFYLACRRNQRSDVQTGRTRSRRRKHFQFDYTVAARYSPRYKKYTDKERDRLGEDSDDFKLKYRLIWLLERGMFVNTDIFGECGIKDSNSPLTVEKGRGKRRKKVVFNRPPNVVTYDPTTPDIVAAIDVGRENSTVVTVGKVFWDCPIKYGDEDRFPIHVYNWLELQGDDHEAQHPQIMDFIKNYRVSTVIIDATGKGDPIYSRFRPELELLNITVIPFIFSASSKDIGYKVFLQEIQNKRFTFPAGAQASRLRKWQNFYSQMTDLEKSWRGSIMVVNKQKDDDNARDDYCDSSMLLCWAVNVRGSMEVEESGNPMIGREMRWSAAEMVRSAGAWYRKQTEPSKVIRPSKRSKW